MRRRRPGSRGRRVNERDVSRGSGSGDAINLAGGR